LRLWVRALTTSMATTGSGMRTGRHPPADGERRVGHHNPPAARRAVPCGGWSRSHGARASLALRPPSALAARSARRRPGRRTGAPQTGPRLCSGTQSRVANAAQAPSAAPRRSVGVAGRTALVSPPLLVPMRTRVRKLDFPAGHGGSATRSRPAAPPHAEFP
jgi:hypothetical protein